MNRDDVIRMTREAGMEFNQRMEEMHTPLCDGVHIEGIERFAALVAAAERNRIWNQEDWTEYERSIAAAERDRMCEQFNIPKELAHEKAKKNEAD